MSRLSDRFAEMRAAGRKALLPFIPAGYPSAAATIEVLRKLDPRACACVEVGIPFSDPIADGPVIQAAFSAALERGFRVDAFLSALADARPEIRAPLVAMVSYSIVFRRGPRQFVAAARAAGFDALIVPDLAAEEAGELAAIGGELGCPLVLLVAPTSSPARRSRVAAISEPFIYYQAVAGITGERQTLPADLSASVASLRAMSGKPVCVGFGVSTPDQVAQVCRVADGAIVGSALVRTMHAAVARVAGDAEIGDAVAAQIAELARGLV